MSISLNTELTGYGVRLTHPIGGVFAGEISRIEDSGNVTWQFSAPDDTGGPRRRTREAAQYDALAYWEDASVS